MNNKTLYAAIITALMMCSIFAAVKIGTVNSAITNGMAMNPTINNVTLLADGSDLTFGYDINITTTVTNITAWEARLYWDPAVIRALSVAWGTFMTGGDLVNATAYSGGGESILLGQLFTEPLAVGPTGSGLLATIEFTFVLPGATFVRFLEATVTDDNMVSYDLLANSGDGRVTTSKPHAEFWWWTDDTDDMGDVSAKTHGAGPIPAETVNDAERQLSAGTTVYFTGNFSYDTATRMVWNATSKAYEPTGAININTYVWDYGDGFFDVYTGGNLTALANHTYTAYNEDGWLVNLTVYTGASKTGNYWSSTWRYQGPALDDTVPMWRDVGIVDIWPSLVPFQNWDPYGNGTWGSDWYMPWWYDSTDFWLPNTNDPYWNYKMPPTASQYMGLTSADKRLYPNATGYNYGTYVKTGDTDIGRTLVRFTYYSGGSYLGTAPAGKTYLYYDHDFTTTYGNLDSIVLINGTEVSGRITRNPTTNAFSAVFNATLGDVWYNQAVANGQTCINTGTWVRYYDAEPSGNYTAGEHIYFDYYTRGIVNTGWTTVKEAWDTVGNTADGEGPGLNILVTANNFGSVTETCTVNLYAIGVAVEAGASPVQKLSVERIGQWTGVAMGPHAGTGWTVACNWLPTDNSVYVLLATIETDQLSSGADQDLTNNWFTMTKPVSNIAIFNMTSLQLVPPWMIWNKYLCDINNDGTVGPADFSWITSNFGNRIVGNDYYNIIPTS
jgi:hypothetical protein